MRTIITSALLIISTTIVLTSCDKQDNLYTCTCIGGIAGDTTTNGIVAETREIAKDECERNNKGVRIAFAPL